MRVLVCGSRNWFDFDFVKVVLDGLCPAVIIEGGAPGADSCAKGYTQGSDIECLTFPAQWGKYGKGAGAKRNQQMLDEGKPDIVVAFKDDLDPELRRGGTEDMVRRALKAGVPVYHIRRVTRETRAA